MNRLFWLSLLTLWVAPVVAQDVPVVPLTRLPDAVVLDGYSNESAWQEVPSLTPVMFQPTFEGTMTERTEFLVGYDDAHLYLAGRFYDSDPSGILASSLYRDLGTSADDYFNIVIDPFDDNENGLWFWTTPAGIRGDMAVSNDMVGDNAMNGSWDTFWDVATVQDETGWFAEVRIPFSSLGFQADGDRVEMGLILTRLIARKNERHIYPSISPAWERGFAKPSVAQDVSLANVASEKPIYVTPYVLGGRAEQAVLNDPATAYHTTDDFTQDIGLDLKYNLTSNLTLDLTANTDFAQVEADNQQVNLTRFSLFFPEKRPFFQERAGIFEYTFGFQERLFHSRRIGLTEAGNPVTLLGGARLVGRLGGWDLGLINMQTARQGALPSENFGIVRLRRNVLNENSYVGGIATTRLTEDGTYNLTYGLDGILRVTGDEFLTLKWAQSVDDAITYRLGEASFLQAQWQRRRQDGFNYMFWLTRFGADFLPEMGFFTRRDYSQTLARFSYGWFPGADSKLRRVEPDVFGNVFYRNADGSIETAIWGYSVPIEFKSGATLLSEVVFNHEDLLVPTSLGGNTTVPAGGYTFGEAVLEYGMARGRRISSTFSAEAGTFFDGHRYNVSVDPTWNASKHFELGATYQADFVRFPDRDDSVDAHIIRLRTRVALDRKASASAFIQYSNVADLVAANVRLRYNFGERNDLWIVYNEGFNTNRDRLDPRLPITDNRTILLKYTYTFAL